MGRGLFTRARSNTVSTSKPPVRGVLPQKNVRGLATHANPPDPEVDIIFVHGLDGGSFTTWAKDEDPRLYWPKEWLPQEVELTRARIHTYGYNLDPKRDIDYYRDFAGQFLTDLFCHPLWFGTLPIILVGHSTGGLIVKWAYSLACASPLYNRLSSAVQSFIFISVPHKALNKPAYKKWRKKNPCLTSKAVLDDTIVAIASNFERAQRNKRVVSFVEVRATAFKTSICPYKVSAMGAPEEIVVCMHAGHNSIARFSSPNDVNYAEFSKRLAFVLREIRERCGAGQPMGLPPAYTREWPLRAQHSGSMHPWVDAERRSTF